MSLFEPCLDCVECVENSFVAPAVLAERERIIKLLSDWNEEVAIALIRGENK